MSWARGSSDLARQLASVAVQGSSRFLTGSQLDEALAARRSLLLLLDRVLDDVRTVPPPGEQAASGWKDAVRRSL